MMSKGVHPSCCSLHCFFFFWKHPLSRELDLWTDTRAINPRKPPDQSNGLFGGCTQWRSADETDFSKENLPLHRVAVSHGEEMCWKLAVFFFLCLFFFFLFYFEGLGGDKPEMKHFILVSLTWSGEYFILLIGLVSNQFRIRFSFPQGKCSSISSPLLWICSWEDLGAQEAKSRFRAGWVCGMVLIQGRSCTLQRAGRLKAALIIQNSSPEFHERKWERDKFSGDPCPKTLLAASLQQGTQGR